MDSVRGIGCHRFGGGAFLLLVGSTAGSIPPTAFGVASVNAMLHSGIQPTQQLVVTSFHVSLNVGYVINGTDVRLPVDLP